MTWFAEIFKIPSLPHARAFCYNSLVRLRGGQNRREAGAIDFPRGRVKDSSHSAFPSIASLRFILRTLPDASEEVSFSPR